MDNAELTESTSTAVKSNFTAGWIGNDHGNDPTYNLLSLLHLNIPALVSIFNIASALLILILLTIFYSVLLPIFRIAACRKNKI